VLKEIPDHLVRLVTGATLVKLVCLEDLEKMGEMAKM